MNLCSRNVPYRVRVRLARKRNEDEDSPNRLYTLVTYVPCTSFKGKKRELVMHQSFVSPAPIVPGNSRAFNFKIFEAPHCRSTFVVKSLLLLKGLGSSEADNNVEQQLGVVLMKLKHREGLQFMHEHVNV